MLQYAQSRQMPGANVSAAGTVFANGPNPVGPGQNLTNMTLNHFKAPAKPVNASAVKDTDKEAVAHETGASPKPQIRIRTEHHPQNGPYKAKPSADLAKFEEGLAQGQKPGHLGGGYMSSTGQVPQTVPHSSGLSNNSQNIKHRGSN